MKMYVELEETKVKIGDEKTTLEVRGSHEKRSVLQLREILELVNDEIIEGMHTPCEVTVEVSGELQKGIDTEGNAFGFLKVGVKGEQKDNFKISISAQVGQDQ